MTKGQIKISGYVGLNEEEKEWLRDWMSREVFYINGTPKEKRAVWVRQRRQRLDAMYKGRVTLMGEDFSWYVQNLYEWPAHQTKSGRSHSISNRAIDPVVSERQVQIFTYSQVNAEKVATRHLKGYANVCRETEFSILSNFFTGYEAYLDYFNNESINLAKKLPKKNSKKYRMFIVTIRRFEV